MAIERKYGRFPVRGIPDDEPVFLFRAQDELVPQVIDFYRGAVQRRRFPARASGRPRRLPRRDRRLAGRPLHQDPGSEGHGR